MSGERSRLCTTAIHAVVMAVITGAVFVIVEGLSSTTISLFQMLDEPPQVEASRYDKNLGWAAIPSIYVPDMYGPGKYVRTNSRGVRDDRETEVETTDGKLRIICSGDSFTYGQGVANDKTWCHRLSILDSRFETVNLGLPGYGIDQMYLRYLQDGAKLQHDIHIFAFVDGDLDRMDKLDQHGYGKPVLKLENGRLTPENIPVPRLKWWASRIVERADFRSVALPGRVLARLFPPTSKGPSAIDRVGPIATQVFRNVQRLADEKKVKLIFVFLPAEKDIGEDTAWHDWINETMNSLGLAFIDVTPTLRRVPASESATFFIPESMPADGHYTEIGNEWVADSLYRRLLELPQIQALLAGSPTVRLQSVR